MHPDYIVDAIVGVAICISVCILIAGTRIMSALDNLTAAVTQNASVEASAVTLIQGLAAEIKAASASGNDAAVQALADQITAQSTSLAAAVTANTPAQGSSAPASTAPSPTPAPAAAAAPKGTAGT